MEIAGSPELKPAARTQQTGHTSATIIS